LSDHIEKNEMDGAKGRYMQGFGGGPEGKTPLGRTSHSWEGNIMMDLQEGVWLGMNWIGLA